VHTVFHACRNLEIAKAVASGGFAALSTLDAGYFGQGLYFSHSLEVGALDWLVDWCVNVHVCGVLRAQYVVRHPDYGGVDGDGYKAVIVANLVYGNPYPVIASEGPHGAYTLEGRPMVPKHDIHVTFVRYCNGCLPVPEAQWGADDVYDEVMTTESASVLPVAILMVKRG
jgi:hypothetical protein